MDNHKRKMTIEEAIKKAYPSIKSVESPEWPYQRFLLSPDFWQSLGKALGWKDGVVCAYCGFTSCRHSAKFVEKWHFKWHRFIDHLAEGKTAEEFFETLS
jgi:hypothetical protein